MSLDSKINLQLLAFVGFICLCSIYIWFIATAQQSEMYYAFIYSHHKAHASINMTMTIMKDPTTATYPDNGSLYPDVNLNKDRIDRDIHSTKHEFDLAFVHIPKTGGTTIENVLQYKFNISIGRMARDKIFKISDFERLKNQSDCSINSQWHFPLNRLYEYIHDKSDTNLSTFSPYYGSVTDYFTVVRNPYTRYLSEYKYSASGNYKLDIWMMKFLQENDKNKQYNYHRSRKRNQKLLCTVEYLNLFTSLLFQDFSKYNERHSCLGDAHYLPQYDYIYDYDGNKLVKYVLRYENFTDEFIDLLKGYSNTDSITKFDVDHNHTVWAHACELNVTDLNETNKLLIQEFYKMDFEAFGYPY